MSTATGSSGNDSDMFGKKYEEFAKDLLASYPELEAHIQAALDLLPENRVDRYRSEVFEKTRTLTAATLTTSPGTVLPGVTITEEMWNTTSKKSRVIVFEYISILNLCMAFQGGADSEKFTKEWAENTMRDARASMDSIDFEKLSEKFFSAFGTKG